jgi:hypothetical protein
VVVTKRSLWRSALAGAVIGLVEAAGLSAVRPALRLPLRVVWRQERRPADPLSRLGIWFLDPLPDPRPAPTDLRRGAADVLRLERWAADPRATGTGGRPSWRWRGVGPGSGG